MRDDYPDLGWNDDERMLQLLQQGEQEREIDDGVSLNCMAHPVGVPTSKETVGNIEVFETDCDEDLIRAQTDGWYFVAGGE